MKKFDAYKSFINETEGVLITDASDVFYLTGYSNPDAWILITLKNNYYLTDARYTFEAGQYVKEDYRLTCITKSLPYDLSLLITQEGLTKIKLREDAITLKSFRLINQFVKCEFVGADDDIRNVRRVKTDYELNCIKKAMEIAEKSYLELLPEFIAGVTEIQMAKRLEELMSKNGSECVAFETICVFGENSSSPHGHPGDRSLKNGDAITLDFGATYKGYRSDITRSFCFGYAPEGYEEAYNAVLGAHLAVLEQATNGMEGKEIDAIARDYLTAKGYGQYFTHSLGHGVGIDIHELPNLNIRETAKIEENMVLTDEPGVYLDGKFGIRIEDTVIMKEKFTTICRTDKNLKIL